MTTYSYDWKATYKVQGTAQNISQYTPPDEVKAQIQSAFEDAINDTALQKFTEQFAKIGRTLLVKNITATGQNFKVQMSPLIPYPSPFVGWAFSGQVEVLIQFDTDVEQHEHFSPQGWEEFLLAIGYTILGVLATHTLIAALVILALVIGIVGVVWKLTGTSVWSMLGGGGGGAGDIFAIVVGVSVLVIGGVLLYSLLSGKKKARRR